MAATQTRWQIQGDYFENCSCDLVCPCLISPNAPLTSMPTKGACEVAFGIHIDRGTYGNVTLDGLNVALIAVTPGPMAEGNMSVAAYIDERANEGQQQALGAIFSGAEGGPMAVLAPLVTKQLGVKAVPITFRAEGKRRSVEIPNIMSVAVHALPSLAPDREIWIQSGHPFAPDKLSMAVGEDHSTFEDYGLRFDNSGKNGHYAPISWSNG